MRQFWGNENTLNRRLAQWIENAIRFFYDHLFEHQNVPPSVGRSLCAVFRTYLPTYLPTFSFHNCNPLWWTEFFPACLHLTARIPKSQGIAGECASENKLIVIDDAYHWQQMRFLELPVTTAVVLNQCEFIEGKTFLCGKLTCTLPIGCSNGEPIFQLPSISTVWLLFFGGKQASCIQLHQVSIDS